MVGVTGDQLQLKIDPDLVFIHVSTLCVILLQNTLIYVSPFFFHMFCHRCIEIHKCRKLGSSHFIIICDMTLIKSNSTKMLLKLKQLVDQQTLLKILMLNESLYLVVRISNGISL